MIDTLEDTTGSVNEIPSGIGVHPILPDLVSQWKHTRDWRWITATAAEDITRYGTKYCWSPCHWKDSQRAQSNFLHADWGALDVDGTYDIDQACKDWCDTTSVIMTTKSDRPDSRRFRIIFQWERRISSVDEYIFNTDYLVRKYDSDDQATDGARFFWPGREIVQVVGDGYKQPVLNLPKGYSSIAAKEIATMTRYKNLGYHQIFPQHMKSWLQGIDVENERNNSCYKIGKYLTFWGMPQEKILEVVLNSRLPLNNPWSKREAERAVKSGIRKARKIQQSF